jgi:multiple sugar transport system substrate-binding protein
MKRILKLSILAILMFSVLVACGNNETIDDNIDVVDTSDGLSPYAGETIVVGIWAGSDAEIAVRPEQEAAFTEATGIHVEWRVYTEYDDQLATDLIAGSAPDVFYVDAFQFPRLQAEGVLLSLDEFIENTPEFDLDDLYATPLRAFTTPDGSIYGIPKDFSTLGLYYNIDLLEAAGFSADDIPTDMADLPAFLAELAPELPNGVIPAGTAAELSRHVFALEANGTSIVNADDLAVLAEEGQLAFLEMLIDAFQNNLIARPADLGTDWLGDTFGLEHIALMIEGNWAIGHLENNFPDVNFGTKELPKLNGQNGTMVFTVSYSINAASNLQGAAWEFINFVTGTEGMRIMAEGATLLPSRSSTSELMDLYNHDILAPFVAGGDYATPWQAGVTAPIIAREYNNWLPMALSGDMTLLEAMQQAVEDANADIQTHMR